MNEQGGQSLQNVLSISTAANNRYLLHFNTLNSLTQWTAGIRLSMFEHATLQEAYTGSLIAGKGKLLNNIRTIMERARMPYEDWARVRFGAGTPWRRCWFVITPPDEKEYQKMQKAMKKRSPYNKMPTLKGDLKFYETKKVTKKSKPIATITHAYSAYAIYPQSKPLIDQSTLVKIEGRITIHSSPESVNEGFVFVMPETHPAVSGFEMMLRFLFPVWDTFNLYGRPNRLIADVLDQRGLMFAMPKDRRYGYLEILDVAGLIHTEGSIGWIDQQWRKQMKELTSKRMLTLEEDGPRVRNSASRVSLPATRGHSLRFNDTGSGRSSPGEREFASPRRTETAPNSQTGLLHRRSASEANGTRTFQRETSSRLTKSRNGYNGDSPPRPPLHQQLSPGSDKFETGSEGTGGRGTPDMDTSPDRQIPPEVQAMAKRSPPPGPVSMPPSFNHAPGQKPATRPHQASDLRRGQADLDQATLTQMAEAQQMRINAGSPQQDYSGYNSTSMDQYAQGGGSGYQRDNQYQGNHNQSPSYQQRGYPNQRMRAPLATIPASPFIEQGSGSPVKTPGGKMVQPDYFPANAETAYNPAMAAVAESPYSRSNPDLRTQVQPNGGASGSDPNLVRKTDPANPRDNLERSGSSFSVNRKPVGNVQGSPERRQQQQQPNAGSPYRQQAPPYGQQDYRPQTAPEGQQGGYYPPQQYGQQQQPDQQGMQHGQLPVRGPPQQNQYGQQLHEDGRGGQHWI